MNPLVVYLLLLKATLTSFSGFSSLPLVRNEFVVERQALTDRQLNTTIAVARMVPGPNGLYVVCVGYYAAGWPGAAAGFGAMVTPAFLIIALLRFLGRRAEREDVRRAVRAVTLAGAGLLLSTAIPFARDALSSVFSIVLAVAAFAVLAFTRVDTVWVIAAAAIMGLCRIAMP